MLPGYVDAWQFSPELLPCFRHYSIAGSGSPARGAVFPGPGGGDGVGAAAGAQHGG